jgi:hypothetical protein
LSCASLVCHITTTNNNNNNNNTKNNKRNNNKSTGLMGTYRPTTRLGRVQGNLRGQHALPKLVPFKLRARVEPGPTEFAFYGIVNTPPFGGGVS